MTDTRVTIVDSQARIATRVYASLADATDAAVGTLICVDNGTTGEFYVRVSNGTSGAAWQPITGGISHVAANGTAVSPDPATINFLDTNNLKISAIPDIADPSKVDVSVSPSGIMRNIAVSGTVQQSDVTTIGFTPGPGISISASAKSSSGEVDVYVGNSTQVVIDVTTHRAPQTSLFSASISNNTLDLYAPDPCDCGSTVPPTRQAGVTSACNGAYELAIWLSGIANVALTNAIAQASTPISTGILSVIASINEDLADFGWLLNALSEYWNGTQLTEIQTALGTTANQTLFAQCCYCGIGSATKITGGTLTQIANVIQGNFTDIPLNNFLYNFVLSINPGQADLNYQLGALDTSPTYDCSLFDCTALQNCYSVNPATLQPFYVPVWVVPNIGIKYSPVAGAFYFPIPPYASGESVGVRIDMQALLGTVPTSIDAYAIFFNASLQNVAVSDNNDSFPLSDTLTEQSDGSYLITKRYVELRGLSESTPGAITGALEVTGVCIKKAISTVSIATHRSDLPYTGPSTLTIPGPLTFDMPNTGNDAGLWMHDSWIDFSIPVKVTCTAISEFVGSGGDSTNTICGYSATPVTFTDPHGFSNIQFPPVADPTGRVFGTVQSLYLNARSSGSGAVTYTYYIQGA